MFGKLKALTKVAASATKKAALDLHASAKQGVAELQAFPTQCACSGCGTELAVPPNAFNWTCGLDPSHSTSRKEKVCSATPCPGVKPENLPAPRIACAECKAITEVATSNFSKRVSTAGKDIKVFAAKTYVDAKTGIKHLAAAPTEFNCKNCNAKLQTPTGPQWVCQKCAMTNDSSVPKCQGQDCTQSIKNQQVVCGICQKTTAIPGSNFTNLVLKEAHDLKQESHGAYYFIKGKSYVSCDRCNTKIPCDGKAADGGGPEGAAPSSLTCPTCQNQVPVPLKPAAEAEGLEGLQISEPAPAVVDEVAPPEAPAAAE